MTMARKLKISISLDADVLDAVDRRAAKEKTTRSAIMEQWLRDASRQADLQRLEEETAAYYDALTPREQADDAEWADFASRSSRKLVIDEPPNTGRGAARDGADMQKRGHLYWAGDGQATAGPGHLDRFSERARERRHRHSVLDDDARRRRLTCAWRAAKAVSRRFPCSSASRSRR